MGFKVTITIECDKPQEICQHLDKLKQDIKKDIKRNRDKFENTPELNYDDNNCYGTHYCKVETDYEG